jgi:hypothetical protein
MYRLVAVTVVLGGLTGSAGADNIDRELIRSAPLLARKCREQKLRAVGVLRFGFRIGQEPISHEVEPLCSNLADRVENALVLGADADGQPGVIRGASEVAAARDSVATHLNPAGRKKLFASLYPLAWGKERVKPDGFLTGLAVLSANLEQVTLTISVFTAEGALRPLLSFKVDADRSILADAGLGFAFDLPRDETLAPRKLDQLATASAKKTRASKGKAWPASASGLRFSVLVSDKVAVVVNGKTKGPASGDQLKLVIENQTERTLGVAVNLAGRSLIDEDTHQADRCRKWVLPAKKTYQLRGYYYRKGEKFRPFTGEPVPAPPMPVRSKDRSSLASNLAGLVEVFVYAEKGPKVTPAADLRRLPPELARTTWTLKALQVRLRSRAALGITKEKMRAITQPDLVPQDLPNANLRETTLNEPACVSYRRLVLVPSEKE